MKTRIRSVIAALVAAASASAASAGGPCASDLDLDGVVGPGDLAIMLVAWGENPGDPSDLNGDGTVDAEDLASLLSVWNLTCAGEPTPMQIGGRSLQSYPYFDFALSFSRGTAVEAALDPTLHPAFVGVTADVYIVASKTVDEWQADATLTDVSSNGVDEVTFVAGGIEDNRFIVDGGTLSGATDLNLGLGYDLVIDANRNGVLDGGDAIDGYGDVAGVYVVRNLTVVGPLATTQINYTGGSFLGQRTYYPTDIASMGELPLIVISHGNGHQYTWYNYLQAHLASYGYIVMSHQNNTQPGIEAATITTLTNTEYIINNTATIAGGVLDGHLDSSRITWIGHSRGGEGVVRAYDRVREGSYTPDGFDLGDIVLVSSIAPTDFLGTNSANPWEVSYHLIYGSADGDVSGVPTSDVADSFNVYERAARARQSTYVHGADHNDFNCCGFNDFQGPSNTQIGRPAAQAIAKAAFLALVKHYVEGDIPSADYLWRQYEDLRSSGLSSTYTVVRDYRTANTHDFVVDNYQANPSSTISSSGGTVDFNVSNLVEGVINDNNTTFTWTSSDPMNGMTRGRSTDVERGAVFDWNSPAYYELEVIESQRDVTGFAFLAFRACQGTRHPNTTAALGNLTFDIVLRDGAGTTSRINLGAYLGGIQEPYQRTGSGTGAGWQNEFEVVRMRVTDFLANGTGLDLTDIVAVRFEFGGPGTSTVGRIGLDEIRFSFE